MSISLIFTFTSKILEHRIKTAWLITDQHRLGTILHPKLYKFECCHDEKENSIDALTKEFKKYQSSKCLSRTNLLTSTHNLSQYSLPSRTTTTTTSKQKNLLAQCFDSKPPVVCQPTDEYQEIDDYLAFDRNPDYYVDENSEDIHTQVERYGS